MCDSEYDREVARTKDRPLASGKISQRDAGIFLLAQALTFFTTLWTSDRILLSYRVMWFPLIFVYPFMKRITRFPQAWLGIAMNWGVILSWTTVCGPLNAKVIIPLMGSLWAWTMFYDTIYACQDRKDDIRLGIGSSAIAIGKFLPGFLTMCAVVFISLLALSVHTNGHGIRFSSLLVLCTTAEMIWQIQSINPLDPTTCKQNLFRNASFGLVLWLGMLMQYLTVC